MYYSDDAKSWAPHNSGDGYFRWSIPSQCWSGEKYAEDTIKITLDMNDNEWWGVTEMDQCVKRDLEEDEVLQIREELGLDRWIAKHHPEFQLSPAPKL